MGKRCVQQLVERDNYLMQLALLQAQLAQLLGEVPIGAVLVYRQQFWLAYNAPITTHDPTAHAEILALRAAARVLQNYRLPQAELYVTLEPCMMCLGALLQARVGRLVLGAASLRDGLLLGQGEVTPLPLKYRRQLTVQGGVLAQQCRTLLQDFFQEKRRS